MRTTRRWPSRRSDRVVLGALASLLLLVPLGWLWLSSLVPGTYSVMSMSTPEYGGGPGAAGHGDHVTVQAGGRSVTTLAGPQTGSPDVDVTLVARRESFSLASGETVDGYTLNHGSPGPELRVRQGELLQVTLVNESVPDGVTLHWHGVDVPNAEDGVAGVTQDAVLPGERHVYRFVATDPGTYWYHSHQVSHEQVQRGLFGVLIVEPAGAPAAATEVVAAVHSYGVLRTASGVTGESRVEAPSGAPVLVRVVNTDDGPVDVAVIGTPYRVVAVDARDVVGPDEVQDRFVRVAGGGRIDLSFAIPADGSTARVQLGTGGGTSLVIGPTGAPAPGGEAGAALDLLSYGSPVPLGFDPDAADRRFEYSIGRRPGFVDGVPGLHWTINGRTFPDVPMFVVDEGDVVRMTLENSSGEVHPMHLHGHHVVVLSRNGVPASGSPWWVDSLDVGAGDSYEIAFLADNPGIWTDHCHNLPHANEGLIAHLMYEGVTTPFVVGGDAGNAPE